MNTIPSPQQGDPGKDRKERALPEGTQESIPPYQPEINITEGGEFLDDALRMKDQPLEETSGEEDQQTKSQTKKIIYYEHY